MFVTTLLAVALAAPVPKSLKHEALTPDGTWEVVGYFSDGGDLTPPVGGKTLRWIISGESLTEWAPDREESEGMTFTPRRRSDVGAQAIDYVIREAGFLHEVRESVYERTGSELRVCWLNEPGGRPADCTPREGRFVIVFRRVTDAKK